MKTLTSIRLPELTASQIEALKAKTGLGQSEIITTAIDRMYREEINKMDKNQWIKIIKATLDEDWDFCELDWTDREWDCWQTGNLTRNQKAMISACHELNVEPRPGDMSPNTMSLIRL